MGLLKKMHLRFENKRTQFEKAAKKYNTLNMSMAMTMILFQIILIAINQFSESQIDGFLDVQMTTSTKNSQFLLLVRFYCGNAYSAALENHLST